MPTQCLSRRRWLRFSCAAGTAAIWGGSGCEPLSSDKPSAKPSEPVTLRVLVVDDAPLGEAIQREWHSRTENHVSVDAVSREKLAEASRLPGDIIVFPAALLGHLVERSLIRPLGEPLLASESVDLQDIFPLIRRDEIRWGHKTYALPLGSPQLVLAYRPDLFSQLDLKPPATWDEYQAAAVKLADRSRQGDADQPWRAAAEPLGAGFGGAMLLARAAGYASHPDQTTPLFETPNLEPLIAGPPFIRALKELVASCRTAELPPIDSPTMAMAELLAGRCAMAIGWPGSQPLPSRRDVVKVAFAELPSSSDVFHFRRGQWEPRRLDQDERVPLLGIAGRFAAVTSSSAHASAAEGMVGWLSGPEVSSRIGSASSGATLFRASHRSFLKQWVGSLPADSAQQYFDVVQKTQSRARSMSSVRLPGSDRYLAALDTAVQRAVVDGQDPEESLPAAADDWRRITAELGLQAQRSALSHGLGGEIH
jgi:multiple sugar transport system substrate-binding protein